MSGMLLINIGNTKTQTAEYDGRDLRSATVFASDEWHRESLVRELQSRRAELWMVACVVPTVATVLMEACAAEGTRLEFADARLIPGLDCSRVDIRTVGGDRLANLAAAMERRLAPVILVDCGTAVTTEVVDREGRFLGGAILPGREMSFRALFRFTAQLPMVTPAGTLPPPVGSNTEDAMRAGVEFGLVGAVEAILNRTRKDAGMRNAPALAVGGDREFFSRHITGLEAADEYFTLRGLAAMARVLQRSG